MKIGELLFWFLLFPFLLIVWFLLIIVSKDEPIDYQEVYDF
jgi:hypothetical protein